jgi:Na+-translocating ferredoxin:NAD+ oxidoreductase subunit C
MGIMSLSTFNGGFHPPERKGTTENLPIQRVVPSTKQVWIPVTQGGAPNKPLVQVGDSVSRGQKIAAGEAFMSVPVHASVAGTVKKIETHLVAGNVDAPCVMIESDGSDRTDFLPPLDPFACSRDEALARVREAGIVGMGGASFPAHVKLNPPAGTKIDYLIANGAECEPYLTIDARTMRERADKVVDGVAIAMKITGAARGIIALEDNKADIVPILEKAVADRAVSDRAGSAADVAAFPISVRLCKTKYPQGGEKMLIKALVGREVPSGGLPSGCGCVISNVGTLAAISAAFREGKPLIDRALTIAGGACKNPTNVEVPVGTLVGDLIPETIGLLPGVAKILSGGPMMGIAMKSASFPVQKNTSGVLFLTARETSLIEESPCIGCGRCVAICSCRLNPVLIVRSLKAGDLAGAKRYGLLDCVECGTCAAVCPSHVNLIQHFRIGKQLVREEAARAKARADAIAASHAAGAKGAN